MNEKYFGKLIKLLEKLFKKLKKKGKRIERMIEITATLEMAREKQKTLVSNSRST